MKRMVLMFKWSIPVRSVLFAGPNSGEAAIEGTEAFETESARQAFIKKFGEACEFIGLHDWASFTCVYFHEIRET